MLDDPNRKGLAQVAKQLGPLCEDMVFVGGATVGLLLTDAAAPAVRPTDDVDLIVEVASYVDYPTQLAPKLRAQGFVECSAPGAPMCAFQLGGLRVDVMPTLEEVLGFSNRWYPDVFANAQDVLLGGTKVKVITAPYFVATKLVAFEGREGMATSMEATTSRTFSPWSTPVRSSSVNSKSQSHHFASSSHPLALSFLRTVLSSTPCPDMWRMVEMNSFAPALSHWPLWQPRTRRWASSRAALPRS